MKIRKLLILVLSFILIFTLSGCDLLFNSSTRKNTTTSARISFLSYTTKTQSKTNTVKNTTEKDNTTTSITTKESVGGITPTSNSSQLKKYYQNFDVNEEIKKSQQELKNDIYNLISVANIKVSYVDSRDYFQYTDLNPKTGKIQLFYSHLEIKAGKMTMGSSSGTYNREHVWPQSLGDSKDQPGGHDLHHIRPTIYDLNEARGNKVYGYCRGGATVNYDGITYAFTIGNVFEPLDDVKGDVARILFYYSIKYGYNLSLVVNDKTFKEILEWNRLDPVSDVEIHRNDYVETIQKNRNIFIDYPELAEYIWG